MPARPIQYPTGGSLLDAVLGSVLDELAAARRTSNGVGDGDGVGVGVGEAQTGPDAGATPRLTVLDCGGGSGSRAVPLAIRGASVTVVDSSIDALAILARRAAEAGVAERVIGVQADVENLADRTDLAGAGSTDLVLLHGVLDATREPAAVVAAAAAAVRVGGYLSVVVPNPVAAVLARALAGDLASALAELASSGDPSDGDADRADRPGVLDLDGLRALVERGGLEIRSTHGLGAFSSVVPGSVLDGRPGARATLDELDRRGAGRSPYREIAGQLHLLARRAAATPDPESV